MLVPHDTKPAVTPRSMRRQFLNAAAPHLAQFGLRTPARFEIDWKTIAPVANGDESATARVLEVVAGAGLSEPRLFVQACPHDEGMRRDLSFAGVFKTYHPRRGLTQAANVAKGICYVLAGRRSAYADTYYARHRLDGPRAIDVKLSSFVDGILTIGTAYVHGSRCLLQYFDSYLSLYINDPVRLLAMDGDPASQATTDLAQKLVHGLFSLSNELATSLDVEFVATASGDVVVTQVRPIPPSHCRAWDTVLEGTWARLKRDGVPSIVPGSAGHWQGEAVDLRGREPTSRDARLSKPIFVVRHQAAGERGMSTLPFLAWAQKEGVTSFGLLVDHGTARRNDHLDYILLEDPQAAFVVSVTNLPARLDAEPLRIDSDGFSPTLTTG